MNLYVATNDAGLDLRGLLESFGKFGHIDSVELLGSRPRGHSSSAFVDMPNAVEARAAIVALDGKVIDGRTLLVLPALPRPALIGKRIGH